MTLAEVSASAAHGRVRDAVASVTAPPWRCDGIVVAPSSCCASARVFNSDIHKAERGGCDAPIPVPRADTGSRSRRPVTK
jgi:hypothetical protein